MLMASQGTKPCLGWDRDPEHGTYACTVVTDSWLLLLQRALHASRALQTAAQKDRSPAELRTQSSAPFEQGVQPQAPPQKTGTIAEAGRAAASHVGALQELLDQLLMHWQARASSPLWKAIHCMIVCPKFIVYFTSASFM